ncbi:COP9 signalosome [Mycena crocata]|nr:COP9 signalosome [Mycena crocata]
MSTGPPTPPPSSATEIQDATRTVAPPLPAASTSAAAPTAPPTQMRQDGFTQLFPQIASLASEKNFLGLIQLAQYRDNAPDSERQSTRLLLTAPLVLAYLTIDELPPARCALARLPNNFNSAPVVKQLLALLASTSERKYANVYTRAQALRELVSQPDFHDTSLGSILAVMIDFFLESFRTRTFNLLLKAYTSLPLSLAQMYLGLPADDVLAAAATGGWAYDASTQVLSPAPKPLGGTSNGFAPFSSLATFDFVANSVARLET